MGNLEIEEMTHWHDSDGTLHEIYSGYIFVGNDLLGEISYDSGRADLRWSRCSYAMFCPFCGDVWARIVMRDSSGYQQSFDAVRVACVKHPDPWNIPGSLLANRLEYLLESLPPAAVKREFEVHLNHFEKELAP